LAFFGLSVLLAHFVPRLFQVLKLERVEPIVLETLIYSAFIVLPLAYAFSPQIFTRRYWHFPRNSWKWIAAFAVVRVFGVAFGSHRPSVPATVAFGVVFISPIIEEIVRAVVMCPLMDRWGTLLGMAVTSVLTALVHPQPWRVLIPTVALSIMFIATRRSIAATALAHSILNTIVVVG
jgi:membrane protease YdiL (CAAX protease family)